MKALTDIMSVNDLTELIALLCDVTDHPKV